MLPLVTAIVPSYNYARFVVRAVESCLEQTFPSLEVLVVDDASTDGSRELLQARFSGDPRVRLHLASENAGVSGNFNRGLKLARGRYVAFCCADDAWEPDHLATVVPALERSGDAVLAYARAHLLNETGAPVEDDDGCGFGSCEDALFFERLVRGANFVPFVATVFRRQEALDAGGFNPRIQVMQVYDLWLRLAATRPVVHVASATVRVSWHGANASARGARTSLKRKRDAVAIFEGLLERELPLLRERGLERAARGRLADALSRLARRTPSREEARACSLRALRLAPFSASSYLGYVRALVPWRGAAT